MNRKQRQRLANRAARRKLREGITDALLIEPAILSLGWGMLLSDIRARFGCTVELAHESIIAACDRAAGNP